MSITSALGWAVLVFGVLLNLWVAKILFIKMLDRPEIGLFRERFASAVLAIVIAIVFGLIFINNDTLPPPIDIITTKIITRLSLLGLVTFPALIWLWLYRKDL